MRYILIVLAAGLLAGCQIDDSRSNVIVQDSGVYNTYDTNKINALVDCVYELTAEVVKYNEMISQLAKCGVALEARISALEAEAKKAREVQPYHMPPIFRYGGPGDIITLPAFPQPFDPRGYMLWTNNALVWTNGIMKFQEGIIYNRGDASNNCLYERNLHE